MGFKWTRSPSEVFPEGYRAYTEYVHDQLVEWAEYFADLIERDMQVEAPWKDQSGDTRKALWADVVDLEHKILIVFGHGPEIEHALILETMKAGALGIVAPTFDKWSAIVWDRVRQLME